MRSASTSYIVINLRFVVLGESIRDWIVEFECAVHDALLEVGQFLLQTCYFLRKSLELVGGLV